MKVACQYFKKCSGCTRLSFPYVKQLYDKQKLVRERLARVVPDAKMNEIIANIEASPLELGYRTSTKLCLHEDAFGRPSIGLYDRGTKNVVAIPGCPVHDPAIERLLARLMAPRRERPAPFYRHDRRAFQPARLKFISIRYSPDTGEAGIVISHTGVERNALHGWVEDAKLGAVSVYDSLLSAADEDRVMAATCEHLAGPKTFRFRVGDRDFALTPMAFFQANHSLSGTFVDAVVSDIKKADTVLDLYGGFGAYGFRAVTEAKQIVLVDGNPYALDAARAAATVHGFANKFRYYAGSCEDFLERQMRRDLASTVTHIIVNPPRSGLSPKVKQKLSLATFPNLRSVVYASCDLDTLARDLAALTGKNGLTLTRVQPFDMFPQTDHIEAVVRLFLHPSKGVRVAVKKQTAKVPDATKASAAAPSHGNHRSRRR